MFDGRYRAKIKRKSCKNMITLRKLSNIAILSFKNGYRLHIDSINMYKMGSYPTATYLSILAMEEFGKYFSLSSYVFYKTASKNRDLEFEDNYLKGLYSHVFKQRNFFGGHSTTYSEEFYNIAASRWFEELKQQSIYVNFRRDKGNILYNLPYTNPLNVGRSKAKKQIKMINSIIIKMIEDYHRGNIEMDEEEVNNILSKEYKNELLLFKL